MTGLDIVTTYCCPSLTCGASVVSVVTFVHVILAALDYTPGYTIDLGMTLNYTVHITVFIYHACINISALIYVYYSWFVGGKYLICWYSISDFVWLYFILLVPFLYIMYTDAYMQFWQLLTLQVCAYFIQLILYIAY